MLTTSIQHCTGGLEGAVMQEKGGKRNPDWKGRSKTILEDNMILYVENPEESTKIIRDKK